MIHLSSLSFLEKEKRSMVALTKKLALINSFSNNTKGIKSVQDILMHEAKSLGCKAVFIKTADEAGFDLNGYPYKKKSGDILKLTMRPNAPFQCLLMGHADTVYPPDSPFQTCRIESDRLHGPGVADMKGGLAVLLKTLEAIERSPNRQSIGWTVLINGDEETGSSASRRFIEKEAFGKACALVFEPSKENGAFIKSRPASANYLFVARGKGAHAGRDFYQGVNAIAPLMRLALDLSSLTSKKKKIQVNIAKLVGGSEFNVVPDRGSLSINIRAFGSKSWNLAKEQTQAAFSRHKRAHPDLEMHLLSERPSKEFDKLQKPLFDTLNKSGALLGIPINLTESGGVTDGNLISAVGVPCIDSFGVIGSGLHTVHEEAHIASFTERAKLAALTILMYADAFYKRRTRSLSIPKAYQKLAWGL
ncbi:hydrolase [Estrella lausannensis]|uniref:Metalloprotease n=1 Tax=Estrella lausannensis TaxID=483423 RepID=A0A0H5DQM2_9BACT|nr:hydrolase [Estrella lausannensis]CRX38388.1 Metalloprotease [Estrella lausannensis]